MTMPDQTVIDALTECPDGIWRTQDAALRWLEEVHLPRLVRENLPDLATCEEGLLNFKSEIDLKYGFKAAPVTAIRLTTF